MIYFEGYNFTELYYRILNSFLSFEGGVETSRIGKIRDLGKVCITLSRDNFRMPLLLNRGFNPIFALCESAWILNGDNEVKPLLGYINNYSQYSDDGLTLNGAYGYRLINHFGFNQIEKSIELLRQSPDTRRAVLQLWSTSDLGRQSNDIPCNTQVMLKIKDYRLNITVINRSNDAFLGIPYNIFVFFILQQYIASRLNIEIGTQSHFTDSLHLYERDMKSVEQIIERNTGVNFDRLNRYLQQFSWTQFVLDNECHHQILNKDLTAITNPVIKSAAMLYYNFDIGNKQTDSINDDLLALSCVFWAKHFGKYKQSQVSIGRFEKEIFNGI